VRNRPESPAELLEQLQYSPIEWPWKTTRLRRDPVQDVRQRMSCAHPTAAETYHRNSVLFPARLQELPATWLDADEVRREFLHRQVDLIPPTPPEGTARFPLAVAVLDRAVRADGAQLSYAFDLRLSDATGVVRYEPRTGRREALRGVTEQEARELAAALMPVLPAAEASAERLFLIACFPRNEVLYGARSYRRTLIEAGRVVGGIAEESRRQGTAVRVTLDFFDAVVNAFVDADGVEEATLAVLEFGGAR
jgi:hypothetical protein